MSVYKRCSRAPVFDDGTPHPWFCETSPRCQHHWHYAFRLNGRRYRASTETHDKRQAENIEARERSRILDGLHGIRRQPDITFKEFANIYLRDHADLHKKSAKRDREILEQRRLLDACVRMPKLQALLKLALITGARTGELLELRWEDCQTAI
jgi:integrase